MPIRNFFNKDREFGAKTDAELQLEKSIAEEFTKNDDIVDIIQQSTFGDLISRFGVAEEDESVLDSEYDPTHPDGFDSITEIEDKEKIKIEQEAHAKLENPEERILTELFDSTISDFDRDSISFGEIDISDTNSEENNFDDEINNAENSTKVVKDVTKEEYDSNVAIIYNDKSVSDGIKRNSDEEVIAAFLNDNSSSKKRKQKKRS